MLGYGVFFMLAYFAVIPIQNYLYQRHKTWNLQLEIGTVLLVFFICFLPTFLYYKSALIVGTYSFSKFLFQIYLPTIIILTPILIFLRGYFLKFVLRKEIQPKKVKFVGTNKLDTLQILLDDLIFIKGADNYIEIHYKDIERIEKKMIRLTLKKAHAYAPDLIKTHRSYLINPSHFITWQEKNIISITAAQVPVSDTYREKLRQTLKIRH